MRSSASRSVWQTKLLINCSILLCILIVISFTQSSQLDLHDALFLTKNSFKELKEQYLDKGHSREPKEINNSVVSSDMSALDIDGPFNSFIGSYFPIDSRITYNTTDMNDPLGNSTMHEIIGRYASFSPTLNHEIVSQYKMFPNNACNKMNRSDYQEYEDKIVIILRGDCTFVDKVSNLLESGLNPKCIIIGNNEPYRGLITMYSNSFNQDGSLRVPIIFITNEDYKILQNLQYEDLKLAISTASLSGWFNVLLSMALSPPLLIVLFYLLIKCVQGFRRRQINRINEKLVKKLPVYIYNKTHLIHAEHFYDYLKITDQINMLPSRTSSAEGSLESSKPSPSSSTSSLNRCIINGVDIKASSASLHLLTSPKDFYPAYKCSICLERFVPLASRVLVLECKHIYHEQCLSNWLINFRRSCPLCNNTISQIENPYILAGQDPSDYGSINDHDLEAQRNNSGDMLADDQSEEDDLYHTTSALRIAYLRESERINLNGSQISTNSIGNLANISSAQQLPVVSAAPLVTPSSTQRLPDARCSLAGSSFSDATSFFSATTNFDSSSSKSPVYHYSRTSQSLRGLPSSSPLSPLCESGSSVDFSDFITPDDSPIINDRSTVSKTNSNDSTINLADVAHKSAGGSDNNQGDAFDDTFTA